MVPQLVSLSIALITSILVSRGLGSFDMGNYALVMSIVAIITGLSDLGIGQTAIRFASRAASDNDAEGQFKALRWAFRLRITLVFILAVVSFVMAPIICNELWHSPELILPLRLCVIIGVFTALAHIPNIYFQSIRRFKMNSMILIGQSLISFIFIIMISYFNKWSLNYVIVVSLISTAIGAAVFLILVPKSALYKREEKLGFKSLFSIDNEIVSFAFFMVISTAIVLITTQIDIWLMGYYIDKDQIGAYSIAKNFTLPLTILLSAINISLWPRASSLKSNNEVVQLLRITFQFCFLIFFVCLIYSAIVPISAPLIFGNSYQDSILLGQLLCARYCISILICPLMVIGYSFGLIKIYCIINLAQFFSVFLINIICLPMIGPAASAIALIFNDLIALVLIGGLILYKMNHGGFP
jgi:O-antigen/teichoic acid export membrane protein